MDIWAISFSGAQTNYASGATYAPYGRLAGFVMGNSVNNTPLQSTIGYNNRLQATAAQPSASGASLFKEQPSWGTTHKNGTLQSETVCSAERRSRARCPKLPKATASTQ